MERHIHDLHTFWISGCGDSLYGLHRLWNKRQVRDASGLRDVQLVLLNR
jgi:hypothetical protein